MTVLIQLQNPVPPNVSVTRRRTIRRAQGRVGTLAGTLMLLASMACHDLSGTPPLPAGTRGPETYNTPSGALQQARGAVGLLRQALWQAATSGAILTDELTVAAGSGNVFNRSRVDARIPDQSVDGNADRAYEAAQRVRGQTRLARGALLAYAPDAPASTRGFVYAIEGYAEIFLADLFCSGVPLSTIDFGGGFTYRPGSSTLDVYRHAAALFDTATSLAAGNDSIETVARVGWGRALLALGLLDSAAHVVAPVKDTAAYRVRLLYRGPIEPFVPYMTVADREGRNGLPYVTSVDPRTRVTSTTAANGEVQFVALVPAKYLDALRADSTSVVMASGVEARLIEAEADLARNGTQWLAILNALRTNGNTTIVVRTGTPGVSPGPAGHPDTTWGPGTGAGLLAPSAIADDRPECAPAVPCTDTIWYRGLAPLRDPGVGRTGEEAKAVRLNLIMRERAFWLFLTGHRQGDLRRLVRNYERSANTLYPTGLYSGPEGIYGDAVSFPIPDTERRNSLFKGCMHNGA